MYKLLYSPHSASMVIHRLFISPNQPVELILPAFAANQQKYAETPCLTEQGRVVALTQTDLSRRQLYQQAQLTEWAGLS
ncbi:MAG: hypothetical protein E6Q75_07400 [Rheinheimera sp.]|nr:MAG: hypothetical protein E6Q75_07400 [Rheinheimera sp.]